MALPQMVGPISPLQPLNYTPTLTEQSVALLTAPLIFVYLARTLSFS